MKQINILNNGKVTTLYGYGDNNVINKTDNMPGYPAAGMPCPNADNGIHAEKVSIFHLANNDKK